jgi:hypothetical protein
LESEDNNDLDMANDEDRAEAHAIIAIRIEKFLTVKDSIL